MPFCGEAASEIRAEGLNYGSSETGYSRDPDFSGFGLPDAQKRPPNSQSIIREPEPGEINGEVGVMYGRSQSFFVLFETRRL